MRLPVMRKLLLPVFILFVLVSPGHVMAATVPSASATPASQVNEEPKTKTLPSLATMKVKEFEKLAGQKLTLKEKIAFKTGFYPGYTQYCHTAIDPPFCITLCYHNYSCIEIHKSK